MCIRDRQAQTGKILNTEPDIFSFNAMGKTGKFFLGPDGNWKIISDFNFKVVFDYNDANNFITPLVDDMPLVPTKKYQRTMKGFELIDDEGYRYYFGMDGTAIDYSCLLYTSKTVTFLCYYFHVDSIGIDFIVPTDVFPLFQYYKHRH